MSKTKNIIVLCLTAALVYGGFLWQVLAGDKDFSDSERRGLAQAPKLTWENISSGQYMEDFEEYTLDQFPLRDSLRSLKAFTALYILGQRDNNQIYVQEGYASKLEYPLSGNSVEYAIRCFDSVYRKYLAGKDVSVYAALIPDKNYYLAEKNGYPSMDYDRLYELMESGLEYMEFIDLRDLLDYDDFYRTDTHWRQERLMDVALRLGVSMGAEVGAEYEEMSLEAPFYGVYYGQAALPLPPEKLTYLTNKTIEACTVYDYETKEILPVYDMEKADGKDPYEMFLSGSKSLLVIENPKASSDKELIIFRDSFGSSIAPLLIEGYARITLVDIRYIAPAFLGQFIEFDGQDVLFLYSTLVLNNSETLKK